MMTILWWVLVGLCLVFGFLGCFINKVPGPIAVVIATLLAILCLKIPIEWGTFAIIAALAVASTPTTLKRLWGYIDGADTTRRTTLCLLSQFLGYADWEAYLSALASRTDVESEAFAGEGLNIDDLQAGDCIEVTWLPNRRCVFRYEGNARFFVTEAENAKLHVGDRFETACFLIGKPMYIDRLVRGDNPPTAYVAGSKNGLLTVRKI